MTPGLNGYNFNTPPAPVLYSDNAPAMSPHKSLPPPGNSLSPRPRLLELRLMHHYTLHTCKTFTFTAPETEHIWQVVVPELAYHGHPYLVDAILAVAALHLRSKNPADKELVQASHNYMGSSLREYSSALTQGINSSNAEALFLTSTLIAFQSTATRTFIKDEVSATMGGPPGLGSLPSSVGAYSVPLSLFHSFQGVKAVTAHSWQYIRHSPTVSKIINSQQALQLDFTSEDKGFFGRLLDGIEEEVSSMEARVRPVPPPENFPAPANYATAQGLQETYSSLPPGHGQEMAMPPPPRPVPSQHPQLDQSQAQLQQQDAAHTTRQAYQHAVAVLNWAHKIPHRGAPLAFPATVSRRFVELLEERRPRAMVILASYFALLRSLDGVWWLHGMARREVLGVHSLFNNDYFGADSHRRWMPDLDWAVKIAIYEPDRENRNHTQPEIMVDDDLGTCSIPPEVWGADWANEERKLATERERDGQDFVSQIDMVSQMVSPVQSLPAVPDAMSIDGLTR